MRCQQAQIAFRARVLCESLGLGLVEAGAVIGLACVTENSGEFQVRECLDEASEFYQSWRRRFDSFAPVADVDAE